MNTLDILNDLYFISKKYEKKTNKSLYFNVFPADLISNKNINLKDKTSLIIYNTDNSYNYGEHWLSLFIYTDRKTKKRVLEYFDSYGCLPKATRLKKFIKSNSDVQIYNKTRVQSPTSIMCGKFGICFLWHRINGRSLNSYLKLFCKNDLDFNDEIVQRLYLRTFKRTRFSKSKKRLQFGGKIVCNQCCKPEIRHYNQ